jgi:hypothetical protein
MALATDIETAVRRTMAFELDSVLLPEAAAALVRTRRVSAERMAEAAGVVAKPEWFAALAPFGPTDALVVAARSAASARPWARAACLGELLGVAPHLRDEVLADIDGFSGEERIYALTHAFPFLDADEQIACLRRATPGLARTGAAGWRLAKGVRPGAFDVAWQTFEQLAPKELRARAALIDAASPQRRAELVGQLIPSVRAARLMGHSAIESLLRWANASQTKALLDLAFDYPNSYEASTVARVVGDERLRVPEIEARYVRMLDAGRSDYPWDLAQAYAHVASLDGPLRDHCLEKATTLLDSMPDSGDSSTNPFPVAVPGGTVPVATCHRLNVLLAVAPLLTGEERSRREREILQLLRTHPDLYTEDQGPVAWHRAANLDPSVDEPLLDAIDSIVDDSTAFHALGAIAVEQPRFEDRALDRVMARLARRTLPELAAAAAAFGGRVLPVHRPPIPVVSISRPARALAGATAVRDALAKPTTPLRISALRRMAYSTYVTELPTIDDPIAALVASALLLDQTREGLVDALDRIVPIGQQSSDVYRLALLALASRLTARDRVRALQRLLPMPMPLKGDQHAEVQALLVDLDRDAWPVIATCLDESPTSSFALCVGLSATRAAPPDAVVQVAHAALRLTARSGWWVGDAGKLLHVVRERGIGREVADAVSRCLSTYRWGSMSSLAEAIEAIVDSAKAEEREGAAALLRRAAEPGAQLEAVR